MQQALEMLHQQCVGVRWVIASLACLLNPALYYLGNIEALRRSVAWFVEDAQQRGDIYGRSLASTGFCNQAWLADDDPETARRFAQQMRTDWPDDVFTIQQIYEVLGSADIAAGGRILVAASD